ncbi:TonB-dependent receptor [Mucilaginibacter sp. Mucisp86]|uniref:TonB-dependent receptor n=1 Tax=Mucilaginibacter sp. Mucisp86 TaxID=3243060 RepID=UPI0039B5C5A8
MKLTLILLTVTFLQVSAATYAQKVTLKVKQTTLKEVFEEIRNQTNYDFLYNSEDIKLAKPVTVDLTNATINQVMDLCLSNQSLTYTIDNKTILIRKKTAAESNAPKKISGKVVDSKGLPLPGVTVKQKGSAAAAITDLNGNYAINVTDANATLVFSFVGFRTKEIALNGRSEVSITLEDAPQDLTEVVVVAYGVQRKETVTGAITSIGTKDLVQSPVANLSNALAGRLSGLTVTQTSGKPGDDGATLYVRGVGTYTGQTAPLIMVDGIARDSYNDIDPNEVESISILKDASATAVYGVRGANGVILITTKRGKEGAPKVSATFQTAISQFSSMPNFVNSYQYATLLNEQSYENYWIQHSRDADVKTWNDFVTKRDANWIKDATIYYSPEDLKYYQNAHTPTINGQANPYYDPYGHPDQDWKKQIFNKFAPQTQVNANITGGTKATKYFVSLGYLAQGGLFNTDYMPFSDEMQFKKKRYNLRSNLDFDVNSDFRVSVDVSTQYVTITGMDNDGYTWEKRILWSSPLGSPGIINGKFVVPFSNQNDQLNPLYAIANSNNYNITTNSTLNSAIKLSYKLDDITPGLSVNARGAYDSYFQSRTGGKYTPLLYGLRPNPNGNKLDPILVQLTNDVAPARWTDFYTDKWRKVYGEFSINYNRVFAKKHTITALILANAEKKYDPNLLYDLPHAYEGVSGRVTYNYADRYLAEYNMGYNGSENFPEGKRFGFLPAYSLGWLASNESFFPKQDYVTYLKIRGSLGKVGNDGINIPGTSTSARYLYLPDTWQYVNGYNAGGGYTFGTLNDRNRIQGARENVLGNPDVTWETATKSNIGLETHLFNDRLSLIYDHYNEHRKNILSYKGSVPGIVQATLPPYNLGEVKNWGDEIELSYTSAPGKFTWWVKGNASTNHNKILFKDEAIAPGLEYQAATGRPINQGSYLQADGLYTSWSQLYNIDGNGNPILSQPVLAVGADGKPYNNAAGNPVYQKDLGYAGAPLQPGEVRLKDVNGDGVINEKDYVRSGKTDLPTLSYGVSFGFSFHGFDFSALFQGQSGVAKYAMQELHFNKQQSLFDVDLNRYTQDRYDHGDRIDFPIAAYNQDAAYNTFFLKSTAFVRLKNAEIGYTLKPELLKKIGVRSARFYINGYNLYTWSPNKIWGDPENLGYIGYPLTRTYNVGVNVNF